MSAPRLCCLRLSEDFSGFGFSLVATKNETGQFIEDVKQGSPAEKAGMMEGDMVIEVNCDNICKFNSSFSFLIK